MLAACRRLSFADSALRQGRFQVNTLRLRLQMLAGKTIGLIGMGRIGQANARRQLGWEVSGLYADPIPLFGERRAALNLKRVDRDTLLRTADIVSLHAPLTDETRSMSDAAALATMKRAAVLVNTARGSVVDQAALVAALESGHFGAAGQDVYEQEPLPAGHALAHFPNVVLTPHIAAATHDTFAAKVQGVFANIGRFHAGTSMQDQVL
jgi:phosphoglycerate dehydrogenase-like enzyme